MRRRVPATPRLCPPLMQPYLSLQVWSTKIQEDMEAYEAYLATKVADFRKLDFWNFETGPIAARERMKEVGGWVRG
jgi:hypothetical protein